MRQINLNHLAVSRPIMAARLHDDDAQTRKAPKEVQRDLRGADMTLAHDGKNEH